MIQTTLCPHLITNPEYSMGSIEADGTVSHLCINCLGRHYRAILKAAPEVNQHEQQTAVQDAFKATRFTHCEHHKKEGTDCLKCIKHAALTVCDMADFGSVLLNRLGRKLATREPAAQQTTSSPHRKPSHRAKDAWKQVASTPLPDVTIATTQTPEPRTPKYAYSLGAAKARVAEWDALPVHEDWTEDCQNSFDNITNYAATVHTLATSKPNLAAI